jgi:glycine/serine hydroxymethyltransferase
VRLHARVLFRFAFSYFHHVHLCSLPSSGFSAYLQVLINALTAGRPCVGFHLHIGVHSTLMRAFVLCSRTRYSFIPYPSDYMFVRWHVGLSNR